jgi:hypothetical protein
LLTADWDTHKPWLIAQVVQNSAWDGDPRAQNDFSTEAGGQYHAALAEATRIVDIIERDAAKLQCDGTGGSGIGIPPGGPTDSFGLPRSYRIPGSASPSGRLAVAAALSALGRPYVFGAT